MATEDFTVPFRGTIGSSSVVLTSGVRPFLLNYSKNALNN